MKTRLLFLCLLASAMAVSVKSKPHRKHHVLSKHSQTPQEKDMAPEEPNEGKGSVLPTFLPFEASSQEQEDEDLSYDNGEGLAREEGGEFEEAEGGERSTPVLLSEEALAHLLQGSEEEKKEPEPEEEEQEEEEEETEEANLEEEEAKDANVEEEVEDELGGERVKEEEAEETDSSTESEIPVDLDYAGDSDAMEPLQTKLEEAKPLSYVAELLSEEKQKDEEEEEEEEKEEQTGDELPTAMEDYDSQQPSQDPEDPQNQEEEAVQDMPAEGQREQGEMAKASPEKETQKSGKPDDGREADLQEAKNSVELGATRLGGGEEEEWERNESGSHAKGKARKQKKNQRAKKVPVQSDEASPAQVPMERAQRDGPAKEPVATDNTVHKPKRRKNGKWAPLVGMNPVQIRATVELYPSARPSHGPAWQEAASVSPCENFRCKRGKTCKMNEDDKPVCVCQEPLACPPSLMEFDHVSMGQVMLIKGRILNGTAKPDREVCGTDNKTYDTSCQLFATKCNLEGTKRGHRLHLDYTGSCKFIAPCLNTELAQFPLRMRDWLKNVLLQLYEHDNMSPGFLTPKQRVRVQKIHESERRLHAGDHPIELLAQDFEKNYNMYIYPVHWQFAQMDQHPSDRSLSHSELAPLRVPLVPMEHCTSRFFQECDADKDKLVSIKEWCHCFGIKDEDMDSNLLF